MTKKKQTAKPDPASSSPEIESLYAEYDEEISTLFKDGTEEGSDLFADVDFGEVSLQCKECFSARQE